MISSRKDYKYYLKADELALNIPQKGLLKRIMWNLTLKNGQYQRKLRIVEYYTNCSKSPLGKIFSTYLYYRLKVFGQKIGYTVPRNVCGPGLALVHVGTIIMNDECIIGDNFRCQAMVNIGKDERLKKGERRAPIIGNNVVVMPGAKIFGGITIADDIVIGSNAVVNKSFHEPGVTIAGVPAKMISNKSSFLILGNTVMKEENNLM